MVPEYPTFADAATALRTIREAFATFPFADSVRVASALGSLVNTTLPPGQDESAFLVAVVTAVCRASLPLAPGVLIAAPVLNGAGTGKGLLVDAICSIAFGLEARAFPAGDSRAELDKRIGAALMEATQVVFIDNLNDTSLCSDLLASILTQRQVDMRLLGSSRMLPLCPNAFVAMTGNGVGLSEDLARRFLLVELDAHVDDPESRKFAPGFLRGIAHRRAELLSAVLTIWRWGRRNESALTHGRALGSYEEWCLSVRDPLLTLGCVDPVLRIGAIKASDPMRIGMAAIFDAWHSQYGTRAVKAADVDGEVLQLIDPHGLGRQAVASYLAKRVGTRAGGFLMTSNRPPSKWGATTYALRPVGDIAEQAPMPPMVPMFSVSDNSGV
jgi:hypothetical protein